MKPTSPDGVHRPTSAQTFTRTDEPRRWFARGAMGLSVLALVSLAAVDLFGRLEIGSISGSAAWTITVFLIVAPLFVATTWRLIRLIRSDGGWRSPYLAALCMIPFVAYAWTSALGNRSPEAFQNVIVYSLFACVPVIVSRWVPSKQARSITRTMVYLGFVLALVEIVLSLLGTDFFGNRPFGIVATILLAVSIGWRSQNLIESVTPFILVAAIILSGSRTASFVAICLIGFVGLHLAGPIWKRAALGAAAIVASVAFFLLAPGSLVQATPPSQDVEDSFGHTGGDEPPSSQVEEGADDRPSSRLNEIGDAAVVIAGDDGSPGFVLNTNGRIAAWTALIDDLSAETIALGNGAGAASSYLFENFSESFRQPHNEYLRLFYDFGVAGTFLFVAGASVLVVALARQIKRKTNRDESWSALLALSGIALLAVTDNPLVYAFAMLPLGLVVGLALRPERSPRAITRPEPGDDYRSLSTGSRPESP